MKYIFYIFVLIGFAFFTGAISAFVFKPTPVLTFHWRKLPGSPRLGRINSPNSRTTKITNLVKGTYSFELTVTNRLGQQGKDTMQVFVVEPNPVAFLEIK